MYEISDVKFHTENIHRPTFALHFRFDHNISDYIDNLLLTINGIFIRQRQFQIVAWNYRN
jgi:hypothetical protein